VYCDPFSILTAIEGAVVSSKNVDCVVGTIVSVASGLVGALFSV